MLNSVAAEEHQVEIISSVVLDIPCVVAVGRCAVAELMTSYALVGLISAADILYERDFFARDFDFAQKHTCGKNQPAYALCLKDKALSVLLYFVSVSEPVGVGDKRDISPVGACYFGEFARS